MREGKRRTDKGGKGRRASGARAPRGRGKARRVAALKHWRGDEVNAPPGNATRALCAAPSNTEPYVREYILPHFTTAVFSLPLVLALSSRLPSRRARAYTQTSLRACYCCFGRPNSSLRARTKCIDRLHRAIRNLNL